jgi:hypothetical protein
VVGKKKEACVRETRETRFSRSSPHFYWLLLVILKSIVLQQNMSSDRFGSKSDWSGPVRFGPDWSGPVRSGSDCIGSNQPEPVWFGSVRFGPARFGPVLTMYYIPHTTYSSNVDMNIPCYRTTGTYSYIVLLLDYMYKVLDGVE